MNVRRRIPLFVFVLFTMLLVSCSPILTQKAQRTVTPLTATLPAIPEKKTTKTPNIRLVGGAELINHKPGEPQGDPQVIHDQSSSSTADQKKAFGGDEYSLGRQERPFNQQMEYLPGLDITRADMIRSGDGWIYFSIYVEGALTPPPSVYGIELDLNIDGRGDLLVQVSAPTSENWGDKGIKTWWDSDGDVGGKVITRSDSPVYRGSGFETLKIDSSSNREIGKIWSRLSPSSNQVLQIAILEDFVGGKSGKFSWKPYTDGVPFPPSQYDLNDYYPLEQAGSPLLGERDYPLKAVYAVDNTCRRLSGLYPSGREQGVCPP
jgi:hypothetical protein